MVVCSFFEFSLASSLVFLCLYPPLMLKIFSVWAYQQSTDPNTSNAQMHKQLRKKIKKKTSKTYDDTQCLSILIPLRTTISFIITHNPIRIHKENEENCYKDKCKTKASRLEKVSFVFHLNLSQWNLVTLLAINWVTYIHAYKTKWMGKLVLLRSNKKSTTFS